MSIYDRKDLPQARRSRAAQGKRPRRRLRSRARLRRVQRCGMGDAARTTPGCERHPVRRTRNLGSVPRDASRAAEPEATCGRGIADSRTGLYTRTFKAKSCYYSFVGRLAPRGSIHRRPHRTGHLTGRDADFHNRVPIQPADRRTESNRFSQPTIWFQLATVWSTILRSLRCRSAALLSTSSLGTSSSSRREAPVEHDSSSGPIELHASESRTAWRTCGLLLNRLCRRVDFTYVRHGKRISSAANIINSNLTPLFILAFDGVR